MKQERSIGVDTGHYACRKPKNTEAERTLTFIGLYYTITYYNVL